MVDQLLSLLNPLPLFFYLTTTHALLLLLRASPWQLLTHSLALLPHTAFARRVSRFLTESLRPWHSNSWLAAALMLYVEAQRMIMVG